VPLVLQGTTDLGYNIFRKWNQIHLLLRFTLVLSRLEKHLPCSLKKVFAALIDKFFLVGL
jgi:hypothetical protein